MTINLIHYTPLWAVANAIRMSRSNHGKSDSYGIVRLNNTHVEGKITCSHCGGTSIFIDEECKLIKCVNCNTIWKEDYHIGMKDYELIKRVGFKLKHSSTLEFANFVFDIKGISRAVLQELVRHRIASYTVKSTRYTLKELDKRLNELGSDKPFNIDGTITDALLTLTREVCVLQPEKFFKSDIDKLEYDIAVAHSIGKVIYFLQKGYSNDYIKKLIPEELKVDLQFGINLRSLINFLQLRLSREAFWEIRELAYKITEEIESRDSLTFELLLEDKLIQTEYYKIKGGKK